MLAVLALLVAVCILVDLSYLLLWLVKEMVLRHYRFVKLVVYCLFHSQLAELFLRL